MTNKNKARTKEGGPKPKRRSLPKPLQGEGMCLAGYGLLGVGEIEELRFRA